MFYDLFYEYDPDPDNKLFSGKVKLLCEQLGQFNPSMDYWHVLADDTCLESLPVGSYTWDTCPDWMKNQETLRPRHSFAGREHTLTKSNGGFKIDDEKL